MKNYIINNKTFLNICSVHDEINNISSRLQKKEISNDIIEELKIISELAMVAKEMGQHMEDGLRNKNHYNGLVYYNQEQLIYNPYDGEDDS